jgi:hypothetical protein
MDKRKALPARMLKMIGMRSTASFFDIRRASQRSICLIGRESSHRQRRLPTHSRISPRATDLRKCSDFVASQHGTALLRPLLSLQEDLWPLCASGNVRSVGEDAPCERGARPSCPAARAMTADLLSRLPDLEREADEHEARARALRQIIAGVRALNGHAAAIVDPRFVEQNGTVFVARSLQPNGPRGREAVLSVMCERPERIWKVIELKREILGRGWAPTPKAVEAALKRMRNLGEVVCPRYGYYKLPGALGAPEASVPG